MSGLALLNDSKLTRCLEREGVKQELESSAITEPTNSVGVKSRAVRRNFRPLGGVFVALIIWEIVSATGIVNKSALSTPFATLKSLVNNFGGLASATLGTLEAWAIGIVAATIFGVFLGTLVGRSRIADEATETLVRMMRPLPSLALIPIAILVAGLGLKMVSGLVTFAAFWPIFINTRAGVHQVDNRFLESANALGVRRFELIRRIVLPAAAPLIAAGIQISISLALVVTVSVELVSGTGGLGQFVLEAQQGNATSAMFAGVVIGGALGWALNYGYLKIVDKKIPWKNQSERSK